MESTHEQTFRVRDLSTRSVHLSPTQAQIVRDIKDIALKPGTNEITIVGFTPTADESSFKVEGTGAAVISDMTVKLLPNRELFSDIYPDMDDEDSEEDEDSSDTESDDDKYEKSKLCVHIKSLHSQLLALLDQKHASQELMANAESRLRHLDTYGNSLEASKDVDLEEAIIRYRRQREFAFNDHLKGLQQVRDLDVRIDKLRDKKRRMTNQQAKLDRKTQRVKDKARRARQREKDKVLARREEARKERRRIRTQLESLWPRECYSMVVTLEVADYTPRSSRRSSVSSMTETASTVVLTASATSDAKGHNGEWASGDGNLAPPDVPCDLAISYVTSSAYWTPTYDLQLSTTANTAVLCFDALLYNRTSESFTNCKLSLSTSQTAYSGLHDKIPSLAPWQIRLSEKGTGSNKNAFSDIVSSRSEVRAMARWNSNMKNPTAKDDRSRDHKFGVDPYPTYYRRPKYVTSPPAWMSNITPSYGITGFGDLNASRMVASMPAPVAAAAPRVGLASKACRRSAPSFPSAQNEENGSEEEDSDEDMGFGLFDAVGEGQASQVDFQESAHAETGLTMTHDLPGLKSLESGVRQLKQRVVRIRYAGQATVVFQHVVVAKYRPTAHLRARIRNTSNVTLLRGPAGITVDGSFIGRSTLPRCTAGDSFMLNLGVDPTIRVTYPQPDVRRASSGIFAKELSGSFHRAITIVNTRGASRDKKKDKNGVDRSVQLVVLDQVPVSQDEKLRVEIQKPRGLVVDGGLVAAGVPAAVGSASISDGSSSSFSSSVAKDWGTATATLKNAGEVVWNVQLLAGRGVTLDLDYDVSLPVGERVTECSPSSSPDDMGF